MRVFVSSTYDDLVVYRERVLGALVFCEHIYKGMEFFGASSRETLDFCLSQVKSADAMICIIGTRYGTRPPGSAISFTEHEVNEALASGIPIYPFFLDGEKQPVLPKHVDTGRDLKALTTFKARLSSLLMPAPFTTADDLAVKIITTLLGTTHQDMNDRMRAALREGAATRYRETSYDHIAEWYDHWYADHWSNPEPSDTLLALISRHTSSPKANLLKAKILDVACGTGNSYVAFKKKGFDIIGCDGSTEMLRKAVINCDSEGISAEGIIEYPINWTDMEAYDRHLKGARFDVLVNTANSFCHLPQVSGYMDQALKNFYELLKPGGLLIIDTKKYIQEGTAHGVPLYRELRFVDPDWIVRTERVEQGAIPGVGPVQFHTRLHYDLDPTFSEPVPRAIIVFTVHGEGLTPQTALMPYYPLRANELSRHMAEAGFVTTTHLAMDGLAAKWKYDIVVGRRPL